MKKLTIILFLSSLCFSCSNSFNIHKTHLNKMLKQVTYVGSKYEKYDLRLSFYDKSVFSYQYIDDETNINIKDIFTHIVSFKYTYSVEHGLPSLEVSIKQKCDISVFKLNSCFNNEKQCYFVFYGSQYSLLSTNEEVTKEYILDLSQSLKTKYISIPGISLYPKGSVRAKE